MPELLSTKISIPLWYDWENVELLVLTSVHVFQFHYGTIGREIAVKVEGVNSHFNSTMVRLGEIEKPSGASYKIVFQFHYGTIGRVDDAGLFQALILFQFHYGTIGSQYFITPILSGTIFQFHYGTIGRTFTIASFNCSLEFQFHYGTIGSQTQEV